MRCWLVSIGYPLLSRLLFLRGSYGRLGLEGERVKNVDRLTDCDRAHQGWRCVAGRIFLRSSIVPVAPADRRLWEFLRELGPRCAFYVYRDRVCHE